MRRLLRLRRLFRLSPVVVHRRASYLAALQRAYESGRDRGAV